MVRNFSNKTLYSENIFHNKRFMMRKYLYQIMPLILPYSSKTRAAS